MRCAVAVSGCLCSALLFGCSEEGADGFTEIEWDVLHSLSPLPDVEYDEAAAALGQKLFYEERLSGSITVAYDGLNGGNGEVGESEKIACATCHMPKSWFVDSRSNPNATSLGAGWTSRNAPTVVNAVYHESFPWNGKFSSVADLMKGPLLGDALMNSSPERIARVIQDYYQPAYDSLFPDAPLPLVRDACFEKHEASDLDSCPDAATLMANVGYALEAYQRRLISRNAPFDRFVAGDSDAISESAKRGLALFIGDALCIECHNTPNFSDEEFHSLGFDDGDEGRGALGPGHQDEVGFFRTPSLRSVAETAPYMHAGQIERLSDVVEFYWLGAGVGADHPALTALELSEDDVQDIVHFLETLTGDPIPCELIDDPTCDQ